MPSFRARYLLPIDSPPIHHGVLVVEGDRIAEVRDDAAAGATVDLGPVVVLPGWVNAHTHLEFSGLAEPLGRSTTRFTEWIARVISWRRAQDADTAEGGTWRAAAVRRGLAESVRCGVTTIADVATPPFSSDPYRDGFPDVVGFLELIGLRASHIGKCLQDARAHLAPEAAAGPSLTRGISPHAPYSVHPQLLSSICRMSATERIPLAMHLAETREELELLRSGSGPFVGLLSSLDAWDPKAIPRGTRPRDYLETLAQAHRVLAIHGNYFGSEEIEFLASHRERISVVYCPRTHARFGHAPYPLGEMLSAGVNVALGTDSRASNPDLSLFNEVRFLAGKHRTIAPETVVRMGTLAGAAALGFDDRVGSLGPGKQADFVVLRVPDQACGDPYELVLHEASAVQGVYKSGQLAWKRDDVIADSC